MSVLSDSIEQFIKSLMTEDPRVELQRNELAEYFRCAPSQINYVLATRFSMDRGYLIESRRGGGGYIRVIRITTDHGLLSQIAEGIGDVLTEREAAGIIAQLLENEMLSAREALIMRAVVSDRSLRLPMQLKDHVRANALKSMLMAVQTAKNEGG